jgi:hypothetical protein
VWNRGLIQVQYSTLLFSFSRWGKPYLPLDLFGAFLFGIVVAAEWFRVWMILEDKGMPKRFFND